MEPSSGLAASSALSAAKGYLFGMSMWGLLASLLFSMAGLFYFKRGKSESDIPMLLCGVALMAYPYFVQNPIPLFAIGTVLKIALFLPLGG